MRYPRVAVIAILCCYFRSLTIQTSGLGFGCVYIATNLYVAECSPRLLRGSFVGTVAQFGYQLGTLIAFWSGYGMSTHTSPFNIAWRISNIIQIPIGLIFIFLTIFYPESPRYLLEKHPDNPSRALETLARLRSGNPDDGFVQEEFHEIVTSYEYRKRYAPGYLGLLKTAAMRKRLCYGFYAMALQQFGGIAALTMYATLIYESLGWNKGRQALGINGVQSVLQLFIVLVNTFTVDRFGRKTLLIWGFTIQSTALLILSSLTTSFPKNNNKPAAVVEIAMFFVVGLTYCWSNGPIAPAIATEIFPQHVRDKAFGISALGQTACLLALTQPWPRFNSEVGPRSYWLLFSLNVVALISVIAILPETKGVSLERMDKMFGEIDAVEAGEHEQDDKQAAGAIEERAARDTTGRTTESGTRDTDPDRDRDRRRSSSESTEIADEQSRGSHDGHDLEKQQEIDHQHQHPDYHHTDINPTVSE